MQLKRIFCWLWNVRSYSAFHKVTKQGGFDLLGIEGTCWKRVVACWCKRHCTHAVTDTRRGLLRLHCKDCTFAPLPTSSDPMITLVKNGKVTIAIPTVLSAYTASQLNQACDAVEDEFGWYKITLLPPISGEKVFTLVAMEDDVMIDVKRLGEGLVKAFAGMVPMKTIEATA